MESVPAADCVAALRSLVDECEAVLNRLGALPEKDLEAWLYNCWYAALIDARAALSDGPGGAGTMES